MGLYGFDESDAQTFFVDWGYDYIKVDWCGGDATGETEKQRYSAIRNAMDKTGRKDLRLNICRWKFPGTWAADVAESWRICPDIAPTWGHVMEQFDRSIRLSAYASAGHYNDMDMLEIGNPKSTFTPIEEKSHFALWCLMKSPLMMGCDLAKASDDKIEV